MLSLRDFVPPLRRVGVALRREEFRACLLWIGLALGVVAQGHLTSRPVLEMGALVSVAALFLFSLWASLSRMESSRRTLLTLLLFSLASLGVALASRSSLVIPLYTLSALFFLLSSPQEGSRGEEPFTRAEMALLGLIVLLGFLLLSYRLGDIPPGFHGDEGESGMQALQILGGQVPSLISVGWYHQPILSFAWQALSMRIFGDTIFGLRMASALVGTLALIPTYLLARLLLGKRVALLATLLLALSHWWMALNRLGINYTQTTLWEVLALYFFFNGLRSRKVLPFALGGLAVGVGLYLYYASRLVPFLILGSALFGLLFKRGFLREYGYGLLALFLSAALVYAPMALYFLNHPQQFLSRTDSVFLFTNLEELEKTHGTTEPLPALRVQAARVLPLFNRGPDRSGQYGYQGPMLDFLTSVLFVLGLAYSTVHWRKGEHFFLLFWFWLTLVVGGVLTLPAPFAPRLVGMMPVPFIFAALALERAGASLARAWGKAALSRFTLTALAILTLGVIAFSNYQIYFRQYINSIDGWALREPATEIAKYIRSLGPGYEIYLLGEPKLYLRHGAIRFIARQCRCIDVLEPNAYIPLREKIEGNVAYILLPHHLDQLPNLQRYYPHATLREFTRPSGEIRFVALEVSKEEVLAAQERHP